MNRRHLFGLPLLALTPAAQASPPQVSLTLRDAGWDGDARLIGVHLQLDEGWKTYWRMPGDSGIPPEFTWSPSQPARVEVQFPTPSRHVDKGGETIGYQGQVLLPVTVTPDAPAALELNLDLFFAVCKDVCVPAQAQASIALGTEPRDPLGSVRAEAARASVPTPGDAISGAQLIVEDGKPVLQLTLRQRPEDIFVESATSAYFGAPTFADDGHGARLAIASLDDAAKLAGKSLVVTYILGGKGHAQTLTLP